MRAKASDDVYDYPFDGDAMVHGVWFDGGEARYRNRYVHTREMEVEEAAGHALWGGLLTGLHGSWFPAT